MTLYDDEGYKADCVASKDRMDTFCQFPLLFFGAAYKHSFSLRCVALRCAAQGSAPLAPWRYQKRCQDLLAGV